MATYDDMRGATVYDTAGDKIGTLDEFYVDDNSDKPRWITVKTGLFGTKSNFVPLAGAQKTDDGLTVAVSKDEVKDAPNIDADERIGQDEEDRLYEYYKDALGSNSTHSNDSESADDDTEAETEEGATETTGTDTSGSTTDNAMTRSEEQLEVNKTVQPTGTVRMKKYIVTEDVNFTVPVSREEVRLVQEPITNENIGRANDGPELSEEEHAVTLNEERVVVDKKVVPKERLRLEKDTVQDEHQVNEQVKKEQIDVAGDGDND